MKFKTVATAVRALQIEQKSLPASQDCEIVANLSIYTKCLKYISWCDSILFASVTASFTLLKLRYQVADLIFFTMNFSVFLLRFLTIDATDVEDVRRRYLPHGYQYHASFTTKNSTKNLITFTFSFIAFITFVFALITPYLTGRNNEEDYTFGFFGYALLGGVNLIVHGVGTFYYYRMLRPDCIRFSPSKADVLKRLNYPFGKDIYAGEVLGLVFHEDMRVSRKFRSELANCGVATRLVQLDADGEFVVLQGVSLDEDGRVVVE